MSTLAVELPATNTYAISGASSFTSRFERQDNGGAVIYDFPVFKVGVFRDSWGDEHTYTLGDLELMISNYKALQAAFPNVPHRVDHSRSISQVCGYYLDLRIRNEFLVGDLGLTEPDAADKYERGTYRSRSAEIGPFMTNANEFLFPVFLGAAFVDIPAVEGLNFSNGTSATDSIHYFTEATATMATPIISTVPGTRPPEAPADPATGVFAGATVILQAPQAEAAAAPAAPAAEPATPAAPATFSLGGETLTFDQVQARLEVAAQFEREQLEGARVEFATKLVTENKFIAPQLDALGAFFKSLDADQFAAAQAVYALAPELSLLGTHGDGVSNHNGTSGGNGPSEKDDEIAKYAAIVRRHTMAGKSQAWIETTDSFKTLQALKG